MVRQRDLLGRPQQSHVRVLEHAGPQLRMPFHDLELLVGQAAGLEQDVVRYPHLADIVHRRCQPNCVYGLRIPARLLSQNSGVQPHAPDMRPRLIVAMLRDPHEPQRNLLLRSPDLGRLFVDFLLHLLLILLAQLHETPAFQRMRHADEQLVLIERLDHVTVRADLQRARRGGAVVDHGDNHHRHVWKLLPRLSEQLNPGHSRHHDVGHQQGEVPLLKRLPSFLSAGRLGAIVSFRGQIAEDDLANGRLIVNHQNADWGIGSAELGARSAEVHHFLLFAVLIEATTIDRISSASR